MLQLRSSVQASERVLAGGSGYLADREAKKLEEALHPRPLQDLGTFKNRGNDALKSEPEERVLARASYNLQSSFPRKEQHDVRRRNLRYRDLISFLKRRS